MKLIPKRTLSVSSDAIPQFIFSGRAVAVTDEKNNAIGMYDVESGRDRASEYTPDRPLKTPMFSRLVTNCRAASIRAM